MSSRNNSAASDYVPHFEESILSGYLHKKTREGKWQKRWFEVNGIYLTYYKSKKKEKLLAALSLAQVGKHLSSMCFFSPFVTVIKLGEIKATSSADDAEKLNGLFSIELNTRIYVLRAPSDDDALHWVEELNKIKKDGTIESTRSIARLNSNSTDTRTAIQKFDIASSAAAVESKTDSTDRLRGSWLKSGRRWKFFSCCS